MARIAGIELPDNKRIDYALTLLYGVGWSASRRVLQDTGIDPAKRTRELSEDELMALHRALGDYTIEGDLLRRIRQDIQRLKSISSYRGIRHVKGLPVRGQRTRTNARTKRGKRKTVGAFKKEVLAKVAQAQAKGGRGK